MLAFVVVKAEPGANPSLGLGNVLIGIEVDFLVFEAAPQPLDEDVVHAAAPRLRGGRLWSVLKIAGRPYRASASSSASTQKSAASVLDSRHASTARLTQSMM